MAFASEVFSKHCPVFDCFTDTRKYATGQPLIFFYITKLNFTLIEVKVKCKPKG